MSHTYFAGSAAEVFEAATLGGARSVGRDDLGRLVPGARAGSAFGHVRRRGAGPGPAKPERPCIATASSISYQG